MFGFLKKFFSKDKETIKETNVQIEQSVPYKVEPPIKEIVPVSSSEVVVIHNPEIKPAIVEEKPAKKKRKPAAMKTAGEKKPRAKRSKNT